MSCFVGRISSTPVWYSIEGKPLDILSNPSQIPSILLRLQILRPPHTSLPLPLPLARPIIPVRPEVRIAGIPVNIPIRHPVLAVPGFEVFLAVHDVHLLEGEGFGFEEEEVDHYAGGEVGAAEDEAEAVADAVGGVGGEEADHEVAWEGRRVS